MNVQPVPGAPERVNEIRALTAQIVNKGASVIICVHLWP
jgi:hypothetical protein